MRLSFPYFIGPSTWRLLHTIGEIAILQDQAKQEATAEGFKEFVRRFAQMYACPYCRHHFNAFVALGMESDAYPIEYLMLGWQASQGNEIGKMTLEDKLATINNGQSLRMFVWKLHNAVSSSIERTEAWYQKDVEAVGTSRWWPNIDAEVYRAQTEGAGAVSARRLDAVLRMVKICTRLERIREKLLDGAAETKDENMADGMMKLILKLEKEVTDSQFLTEAYGYDKDLVDPEPDVQLSQGRGWVGRAEDYTLN